MAFVYDWAKTLIADENRGHLNSDYKKHDSFYMENKYVLGKKGIYIPV